MIVQKSEVAQEAERSLNSMGSLASFVVLDADKGDLRIEMTLWVSKAEDGPATQVAVVMVVPAAEILAGPWLHRYIVAKSSQALANFIVAQKPGPWAGQEA